MSVMTDPRVVHLLVQPSSVFGCAGERPAVDPDRGHEHASEVTSQRPPFAADRRGRGERREVALGEAQIPHRSDDPTTLDQKGTVPGHAGHDAELWMDRIGVVEAGD